jgi:membrane protease YdiL (CAAX protease family)
MARLAQRAAAGPAYEPAPGDLRDITIAGIDVPVRATVALFVATAAFVADATGSVADDAVRAVLGSGDPALDRAVERAVLFGAVPLLVVLIGFRDAPDRFGRPSRYGLRLGDWRWGLGLLLVGLAVMTPIIAWLSTFPDFIGYYRGAAGPLPTVVARNLIELVPAEFVLRGFLLFALLRRIGPLAIVVVQVPFVLTHIGKPEIELWSTFLGGSIFAWLDWRTGSILWSALGHVYVLSLMVALAGAVPA